MPLFHCMRVKDKTKPFKTRCKNNVGKNGIVCDKCLEDAKNTGIFILMHAEVTKTFGIPFKNQVCVEINLSKNKDKPIGKNVTAEKEKETKTKLFEDLNKLMLKDLKEFHDRLGLKIWDNVKMTKQQIKDDYAFRYHVTKEIVNKLSELGTKK